MTNKKHKGRATVAFTCTSKTTSCPSLFFILFDITKLPLLTKYGILSGKCIWIYRDNMKWY